MKQTTITSINSMDDYQRNNTSSYGVCINNLRALGAIYNKNYDSHTDPLFKQCGILKLSDLYQRQVMVFMYDYTHDKLPSSFQNTYNINSNVHLAYETRQSQMLVIPKTKKPRIVDQLPR